MSLETRATIRRFSSGMELPHIDDTFSRRDFDKWQEITLDLTSTRQEVKTSIDTIQYIYAKVVGDATVSIYRNLSPECWQFNTIFLALEVENCTTLSFRSDTDTTLYLYIAGE